MPPRAPRIPSGLRALLPSLPKRRKAPRPRPAAPVPRVPRPVAGAWVSGVCIGPGGSRTYDVYLPAGLRRRTAVPLVLLLHGCGQTPAEFADATRFADTADRNGFLLV